ncbi:MAG: hypothetical protein EOO01_35440 [Chitinophagaceae bacterium]|nr:MAG: hypothetical protein EOO01_35440 [Chitinophagaceae bacterium]
MGKLRLLLPVIIVFFLAIIVREAFPEWMKKMGISTQVLAVGNIILMVLTLVTIAFQKRALENKNPNVFVRSIMSSMLIKMLVIAGGVIIYSKASGGSFSKGGVFAVLVLYLLYLAAEVYTVMKMNSRKNA